MSRTDRLRLLRKLAMLAVLLAGFAAASSDLSVQQTGAAPCCSSCESREAYCYTLPDPWPCIEENDRRCWRWCSFSC